MPPSATSSELFNHFPPLIQLLVKGSQCSTADMFWLDVPEVRRRKLCLSLSRCEEVAGRRTALFLSTTHTSRPHLSVLLSPLFYPFPPSLVHQHQSTQWQRGLDWWTAGSSGGTCSAYWNLLIINYSQAHLGLPLIPLTVWQVETERVPQWLACTQTKPQTHIPWQNAFYEPWH